MGLYTDKFIDGLWQRVRKDGKPIKRYRPRLTKSERKKLQKKKFSPAKRRKNDLQTYLQWGIKRRLKKHFTDKQLRIKKLIYLVGGTKKMMEACRITSYTTLAKWVAREAIPPKYYERISIALEGKLSKGEIAKVLISD